MTLQVQSHVGGRRGDQREGVVLEPQCQEGGRHPYRGAEASRAWGARISVDMQCPEGLSLLLFPQGNVWFFSSDETTYFQFFANCMTL